MPLSFPYSHFKAIVETVIKQAENVKSITRCHVLRSPNNGYGYLYVPVSTTVAVHSSIVLTLRCS
jgi:hypothetical protein